MVNGHLAYGYQDRGYSMLICFLDLYGLFSDTQINLACFLGLSRCVSLMGYVCGFLIDVVRVYSISRT